MKDKTMEGIEIKLGNVFSALTDDIIYVPLTPLLVEEIYHRFLDISAQGNKIFYKQKFYKELCKLCEVALKEWKTKRRGILKY